MTVEKALCPSSPVHVHVEDDTPIHVHLKKPKKPAVKYTELRPSVNRIENLRKPRNSTASQRNSTSPIRSASTTLRSKSPIRSKSPSGEPWIPPPGKSTRTVGKTLSWQGPNHRLEIHPYDPLGIGDISTEDEEDVTRKMKHYEKKIDSLMTDVGTLKNEVDLQRSMREIERKDDLLETSQRLIQEQEDELVDYQDELCATERRNDRLRKDCEKLAEQANVTKTERDMINDDRERLMKKLIETEMDGQAAAKHVGELRDAIRKLREDNQISVGTSQKLSRTKNALLEKLSDFEATNRTLRRLLRDQHRYESDMIRMSEQRDVVLRRLSESDSKNERLRTESLEKERMIRDLQSQAAAQTEENVALSGLHGSLESTKAHLQKQLRTKEADCNRMAVQVRSMESELAQSRVEGEHLTQLVKTAKNKADHDKEALKKATRAQKQRALRSEDQLEQLNVQVLERENQLADLESVVELMKCNHDKLDKEKSHTDAENLALKARLEELEHLMDRVEENAKQQSESYTDRMQEKSTELCSLRLDNDRLKNSMQLIEGKFCQAEQEIAQLRSNLQQYERLVDEYKTQMNVSRRETDETMIRLDEQEKETDNQQRYNELELEKVKMRLHHRLLELEPLPELLKSTELKLQDANERMHTYEGKNNENIRLISDLTTKVEEQAIQLADVRDKYHSVHDESRSTHSRYENLDKRLREADDKNRELLVSSTQKDESLRQAMIRLEEKSRENASLTRQLEDALTDNRRQAEHIRDKIVSKERTLNSRIMEMESQLSQTRAEIARIKREKDENERKFNSRLYDLKDRLEQSHSTNRSMQNYVTFLKNSYANVFGDNALVASSTPIKSALQ